MTYGGAGYESALRIMGEAGALESFNQARMQESARQQALEQQRMHRDMQQQRIELAKSADARAAEEHKAAKVLRAAEALEDEFGDTDYASSFGRAAGGGTGRRTTSRTKARTADDFGVPPVGAREAMQQMLEEGQALTAERVEAAAARRDALARQQAEELRLEGLQREATQQYTADPWSGGTPEDIGRSLALSDAIERGEPLSSGDQLRAVLGMPAAPAPGGESQLREALQPHVVQKGETLGRLAKEGGFTTEELVEANRSLLYPEGRARVYPEGAAGDKALLVGEDLIYEDETILVPGTTKGGPVDDTGETEEGRLVSIAESLGGTKAEISGIRKAIDAAKKDKPARLFNPFEKFGKPATYLPSIKTVSIAAQMAAGGDPSLFAQMIGRQPSPSEIRNLTGLVSDYQDFAGGVRTKATEITRSRRSKAMEAEDARDLADATKHANLARTLLKGHYPGASDEFLDYASDAIGAMQVSNPTAAKDYLSKYIGLTKAQQKGVVAGEKALRDKLSAAGLGFGVKDSQLISAIGSGRGRIATNLSKRFDVLKRISDAGLDQHLSKELDENGLRMLEFKPGTKDRVKEKAREKYAPLKQQLGDLLSLAAEERADLDRLRLQLDASWNSMTVEQVIYLNQLGLAGDPLTADEVDAFVAAQRKKGKSDERTRQGLVERGADPKMIEAAMSAAVAEGGAGEAAPEAAPGGGEGAPGPTKAVDAAERALAATKANLAAASTGGEEEIAAAGAGVHWATDPDAEAAAQEKLAKVRSDVDSREARLAVELRSKQTALGEANLFELVSGAEAAAKAALSGGSSARAQSALSRARAARAALVDYQKEQVGDSPVFPGEKGLGRAFRSGRMERSLIGDNVSVPKRIRNLDWYIAKLSQAEPNDVPAPPESGGAATPEGATVASASGVQEEDRGRGGRLVYKGWP